MHSRHLTQNMTTAAAFLSDALGQRLYLGVVWRRGQLGGPAAALLLGARVFVAGLLPLGGGGGAELLAGRRRHLQHHHAAAGLQQPCTHTDWWV